MSNEVKPPFVSDFGGYAIVERGTWLYCIEKNVKLSILLLIDAVKQSNKKPKGTKFVVGIPITGNNTEQPVDLWKDDHNIYIGCLDEPTVVFNKKYQQLIKHLNSK